MSKLMLMDAQHQDETRVVIVDEDTIEDFDFVTTSKAQVKGNIYLAKITRVEPSLQAAFVEYGGGKQGFLPFSEIHPDYYQIPTEDRKRLIEEELAEAARAEEAEEAEIEQQEERRSRNKRGGRRRGGKYARNRRPENDETTSENEVEEEEEQAEGEDSGAELNQQDDADEQPSYQAAEAEGQVVASEPIEEEKAEEEEEQPEEDTRGTLSENASPDDDEGEADESEVETVSADDAEETQKQRKRGSSFKRYRIQEVIKRNQIVLVQVIKEERGNKGCSLTTYISLAGRYCVLMPNSPKAGGVSRKISNGEQRKKLKEMLAELREKRGLSAIIRTAGIDRTRTEIKRDYEYLVKLWSQIREDTLASTAPSLIYEESDIIKRSIRDMYTNDIDHILVQGEEAYKDSKAFMKLIMPSHAPRVKQYKEAMPIFAAHGVEEQLASMYEPEVKMPSGGYVVIQPTEALISIDVNSGRSTTERNVEETAIKTNLEAAREVARQLRLRDLAGLVVVDFIDMYYGKNRRTLERAMKDALKHDRAKVQVSRISPFGLMELSRQRLRPSIVESSTRICPTCRGTGTVKSVETVAIQAIRTVEREAVSGEFITLKIISTPDVVLHLLNNKRHVIQNMEAEYNVSIIVEFDADVLVGEFRLMKTNEEGKEVLHREQDDERGSKRKSRGRRGGRSRRRRDERDDNDSRNEDDEEEGAEAASVEPKQDSNEEVKEAAEEKPRRRRRSASDKPKKAAAAAASEDKPEEKAEQEEKSERKPRKRASTRRSTKKDDTKASQAEPKEEAPTVVEMPEHEEPKPSSGGSAQPELEPAGGDDVQDRPKRKGWWNRIVQVEV